MEENKVENVKPKEDKQSGNLAMELLAELKRQSKRWMIAFFVVLSLWAATIGGFVWFLNQYEFESYTQDGSGYNNINTGTQGDVLNGTDLQSGEKEER